MDLASLARWAACAGLSLGAAWCLPWQTMAAPLAWGLWVFVTVAALWVTQALHVTATALLVPVLAVLAGVMPLREALTSFAHPVIFLFLGGFALAAALSRHGLDQALVRSVLRLSGGHRLRAVIFLCAVAAVLSMWMSNTATAVMMLPLALALLKSPPGVPEATSSERAFVLLALAYSASLGGVATVVGSPPNALAAAQSGLGFAAWLVRAGPLSLVLWVVSMVVMVVVLRPRLPGCVTQVAGPACPAWRWTAPRVTTLLIFVLAVVGWVAGAPLGRWLHLDADTDTFVALAVVLALVGTGTITWREVERQTQWGVLLLFGGGLVLSEVMRRTGASVFLADAVLAVLHGAPVWLVLPVLLGFVIFLTELVSNTACAALLLPMLAPLGQALGIDEVALAVAVAAVASCAFMLPVATPPNAIVFATDQVPQSVMMRCGVWLNLTCLFIIAGHALFWA